MYDIEAHPDPLTNLIYVSGTGNATIKVIDYANDTYEPLPNLTFLPLPTEINELDRRITIEFSQASPNDLFIVVSYNVMWDADHPTWNSKLYRYDLLTDNYIDKGALPDQENATVCNAGVNPERGLAWSITQKTIAGELWMVHGNTAPIRLSTDLLNNEPCIWQDITSDYYHCEVHVDQYYMTLFDYPTLWVGNDGGVYKTDIERNPIDNWVEMNDGLAVATVYHIATSPLKWNIMLSGQHDNGSNIYNMDANGNWTPRHILSGDGMKPDMDISDHNYLYASQQHSIYMSEDGGSSFNQYNMGPLYQVNWNTYFVLNPADQDEIIICGNDIVRGSSDWDDHKWGLKKYINGEWYRWEKFEDQIGIVGATEFGDPSTWKIEISESNPDIIYAIWRGGNNDEPKINMRIFKSTTGGGIGLNDWVDLNVNYIMEGWISDIAIDHDDPHQIYVACGNKVLHCNSADGANPVWSVKKEFSLGPYSGYKVNSVAFVNGSQDHSLYLGTNYGIFYLNDDMEDVEFVNGNLPHANVFDIEINYGKQTINVATFGRGVWEAGLPCSFNPEPIVITGNEIYDGEYHIYSNIEIAEGATLTITGNVYMAEATSIIVKRTGLLVVDGGEITKECAGRWKGIQVWGDPKSPHTQSSQGKVILRNNALIEYAENAILAAKTTNSSGESGFVDLNFSGGIVMAANAVFRNNKTGARFYKYPANAYEYTSSSFINNCDFIIDENYPFDEGAFTFIDLNALNTIKLNFNHFRNESLFLYYGTGIKSFNSTFFIDGKCTAGSPCTAWDYGEFYNLEYGIYATAASTLPFAVISHTLFDKNFKAVYLGALSNPEVVQNDFMVDGAAADGSYGLYLDGSTGYTIEENNFEGESIANKTGFGIIINNSQDALNEVYNNSFTYLEVATSAQNCNRSSDPEQGLKIKCNDYSLNLRDIYVTAEEGCENPGISSNQGALGTTDMQAGNTFSWLAGGPEYSDYDNLEESPITYYHHNPELSASEIHIVPHYLTPEPYIFLFQQENTYEEESSCPSNINNSGGNTGGDIKSSIAGFETKTDSTKAILTALVDGGDSEVLEQQVLQSLPPETYDIYMSLLGKSPYLSDSVLIAAIEKEDVLPNILIKDILVANPQAAKSEEVMQKVDEKTDPFTPDILAEVLLGKYIIAAKEKLEAQVDWYKHSRAMAVNRLKQYYLSDTLNATSIDSLILLLENENGLGGKYELAFAYMFKGDLANAMGLINWIPSQYTLNAQQQNFYDAFLLYTFILDSLHIADTNFIGLSGQQKTILFDLADNSANRTGAFARAVLLSLGTYVYDEPVLMPDDGMKSSSTFEITEPVLKSYSKINIFPNPAKDYLIIDLLTQLSGFVTQI